MRKVTPKSDDVTKPTSKSGTKATSGTRRHGKPHADILGTVGFQASRDKLVPAESPQTNNSDDASFGTHSPNAAAPLRFHTVISDEYSSSNRPISAIHFHSKYDHILLSAHGARSDGKLGAPSGTIAVWASDQSDVPLQRTLVSTAPITTLQMFSISPSLVLGGTTIGSIHLWDLRVRTTLPISAFDRHAVDISDCHARQPISSARTTITSSPYFITTSISGHVCKWSLSQPSGPISQSVANDPVLSDKVPISTMDLPRSTRLSADDQKGGTNRPPSLFVGTTHGAVCRLEADGEVGTKSWNVAPERGVHNAAVTAVRAHPGGLLVPHLDDVIASSSYDWGLNVWQFRRGHACKLVWKYDNSTNGPIHDVAWSSLHPSVLCCGDDAGVLSVHDLSGHLRNDSTGQAVWKFAPSAKGRRPPITSLQWSNNDRFICTGDKLGNITLWSTTSHMASLPDAEWMGHYCAARRE